MHPFIDLLAFAGLMALGQFSPGPDLILITRTSLAEGVKAGVAVAWGIACGVIVHAGIAVGGLAVALSQSPALHLALTWSAAGYLLYLAVMLLRSALRKPGAPMEGKGPVVQRRTPFLRGLICNLLNPKAVFFIAALTANFLAKPHPPWMPAALWAIVVIQAGVLWSLWAAALQWRPLRMRYERSVRWIDGAFGIALVMLAAELLFNR